MDDAHEWIPDAKHRGEGLMCRWCLVTEAEMDSANGRLNECRILARYQAVPGA